MAATQDEILSIVIERPSITSMELVDIFGDPNWVNPQIRSLFRWGFIRREWVTQRKTRTWVLYATDKGLEYHSRMENKS